MGKAVKIFLVLMVCITVISGITVYANAGANADTSKPSETSNLPKPIKSTSENTDIKPSLPTQVTEKPLQVTTQNTDKTETKTAVKPDKNTDVKPISIEKVTTHEVEPKKEEIVTPKKPEIILYPVQVEEFDTGENRQIVKVYELSPTEQPKDISTEPFERDGYMYALSDIVKTDNTSADSKQHSQTVTVNTSSKDVETVIKQLAPTIDYNGEDGYKGILNLDVSSVKCETAGYKNTNYTISETREYPNLSQNDTSLVPKTINANGKTLTLSNVSWKSYTNQTVDYNQLAESYTAIAKYTGTGTKSNVTGYVATANYYGTISKVIAGKTIYTAYFFGESLNPPIAPVIEPEPIEPPAEVEKNNVPILPIAVTTASIASLISGFFVFLFMRNNVRVYNLKDGKYIPIGKARIRPSNPTLDLTSFASRADTNSFILIIERFATKNLNGKTITINNSGKSLSHEVRCTDGEEYQIDVDF